MRRDLIQTGKNLLAIVLLALVALPLNVISMWAWFLFDVSDWLLDCTLWATDRLRGKGNP